MKENQLTCMNSKKMCAPLIPPQKKCLNDVANYVARTTITDDGSNANTKTARSKITTNRCLKKFTEKVLPITLLVVVIARFALC